MVIGLTGGPGTGKSLVTAELERLGAAVIDADVIARRLTQKNGPACEAIRKEFGKAVFLEDGSLDRKALRTLIFNDPAKRVLLNAIMHPLIRKEIRRGVEALKKKSGLVVVVAPLLFETGLDAEVDVVVVVFVDERTQVQRLMKRDGLTTDEARAMIASQMPLNEKVKLADYVIDNNGPIDAAIRQVAVLYEKLYRK